MVREEWYTSTSTTCVKQGRKVKQQHNNVKIKKKVCMKKKSHKARLVTVYSSIKPRKNKQGF